MTLKYLLIRGWGIWIFIVSITLFPLLWALIYYKTMNKGYTLKEYFGSYIEHLEECLTGEYIKYI